MSLVLRWHTYKLYIGTSRGKNALKFAYLQKVLSFLDGELELLRLKIQHREQFPPTHPPTFKSNLLFAFKPKGLGIIGMAEIVVSLWLLGEIIGTDGKPAPLIRIANAFEYIFDFSFGDIYDKQEAIFDRKPFNRTRALDTLKNAILKEEKKRNQRQR
jgi:hypothetical protein